jgi:hypothetical protein
MTTTPDIRALLHPGYELGDGSADGAQQVGGQWWHPVMGCDSLQFVVNNALATPPPEPPTSQITFNDSSTEEVIRLDKEGFYYKGQFIADAGEAHRLMLTFLKQHATPEPEPPTDDELIRAAEESGFVYKDDGCLFNSYQEGADIKTEVLGFARAVLERWGNG